MVTKQSKRQRIPHYVVHNTQRSIQSMDCNPPPAALSVSAAADQADPRPEAKNNEHKGDDALDQGVQGLTAEEETRELQSLSTEEIAALQADLIGLRTSMSGLHIAGSSDSTCTCGTANTATSPFDQSQLMEIHVAKAMRCLPQPEIDAYGKALQLCPDKVLDPHRMQMFLDYAMEQQEPDGESKIGASYFQAVATQLAKYWKLRAHVFNNANSGANPNAAYLPMTQTGALTPAGAMQLANRKVYQLLPQTDTSGRSVILHDLARNNYKEHTFYDELSWLWYLIETVMEDPNRRKLGVVIMVDSRGISREHICKGGFSMLIDVMAALPISFKAIHSCYPSAIFKHIIFPVVKRLSPKPLWLRSILHYGTTNEVLMSLSGYCLPPDRVPTDLGGQLVVDIVSWMAHRLALEAGTPTNHGDGALLVSDPGVASPSLPAIETQGQDPPTCQDVSNLTDDELYEKHVLHKKRACGQKGDPRMNQTLIACLRNPDLPHLDALLENGFDFSPLSRLELEVASKRDIKDVDGVTLKQRLDNLSRRLRNAKIWIKEERDATGKTKPSRPSRGTSNEQMVPTSPAGSNTSNDASGETTSEEGITRKRRGHEEDGSVGAETPSRRDSFDEVIDEVMAIEDLGQVIDEMYPGKDVGPST